MGLLDCVASPEERDKIDEGERPYSRPPRELSRSDHDISRRRALPLFSSQASLKNIRDIDFWRTRVLRFLYSPEGREDIRILKVPFKQLGYSNVTDFIGEIPPELFTEFLAQTPPDEGIYKDDKIFWVHDGIAEPGIFKWQGIIENVPIIGLQLDRKKAVPFGIHDGKGLFYCKPGHRALVLEHEVTPYKKFLRSFLGLPPRQDSLVGIRDSVRYSAQALAAKNSKPGDKVYLPKEKKWATVQWIGKIEGETVVDLVYEPPKPEAGKPVSPDEPCISRSMSLADFIGELNSEPNTPVTIQPQQQLQQKPSTPTSPNIPPPAAELELPDLPTIPTSPIPESSDESLHSDHAASTSEDDSDEDQTSDSESDSDGEESVSNRGSDEETYYTNERNMETSPTVETVELPKSPDITEAKPKEEEDIQEIEYSPRIPSPKRKGFFGFAQNKKRPKSTSNLTTEQKGDFVSLPELKHSPPPTPQPRNSNLFASLRFKKNKKLKKEPLPKDEFQQEAEKPVASSPPKKKYGLSSSWGALFKSKSKTKLNKLDNDETSPAETCTTPIDEMIPPDQIPTPPPAEDYRERRIDRPEFLNLSIASEETPNKGEESSPEEQPVPEVPEEEKARGEVSLCPDGNDQLSESETSDEEEEQSVAQNVSVEMHVPPSPKFVPVKIARENKSEEIKITTLEKEIVQTFPAQERHKGSKIPVKTKENSSENDENPSSPAYMPASLDRYKETRVRNRPTSFGSFLARIKNLKSNSNDDVPVPQTPTIPTSPIPTDTAQDSLEEQEQMTPSPLPQQNEDRKNSVKSMSSHDDTDGREGNAESPGGVIGITRSLVKPQIGVQSIIENEGNQEGIELKLLDVEDQTPPVTTPPPIPTTDPPKRRPSRNRSSFTFSFTGKRKAPPPKTPTTPTPSKEEQHQPQHSDEEALINNENRENIDPHVDEVENTSTKPEEEEPERKPPKSNSFRSSFKRTFSLTRSKKRPSIDTDPGTPTSPTTTAPTNRISKPRPVTVYVDNNETIQTRDSFRNKRPASVVVDIKPWNMRHGKNDPDYYSSSDEGPTSPSSAKSPNPALLPKQSEANVPKHRMFTTPAFFHRKPTKKPDNEPLISKTSKEAIYKKNKDTKEPKSNEHPSSPVSDKTFLQNANDQPSSPVTEKPSSEIASEAAVGGAEAKLKSALKQRKEIECIPKGLKVNDRVLWYSGKGPIPGTVLRLFKDGTDKYTAMVKFDRDVQEEPLRLSREGDAYIVTVEELITPNMFEPTYANQSEISKTNEIAEPVTPITPSVRFDGILEDDPSPPEVVITSEDPPEMEEHDLPPPFQEEEVTMACGFRRGIQSRDKSCCLETLLFSMFYTTNAFDITMLYANAPNEDVLTQKVRRILRMEIVDPLRREGFCPWFAVKKLRDAVKPLSDEWQTLSTDAEVMMFILFDRALKLQKFISYSNDMSDFMHQLVVDTKDLSKSTTVQHLFETSLQMMDKLKLKTIPTPALILEMPRSNDKLMQYKAVIPNLSLTVSHILDGGPRLCICGAVAKYDCKTCTSNVGAMSIVYCDNCKSTADVIHFQLTHDAELSPLNQPIVILDLSAIICIKGGHYFSFVKCGQEQLSPWVFFDGAEAENPKVCIEQNLSMWLDRLEKYPGRYQDALQYPLLTHILQDSHICIYQPREKSSSV